MKHFTDQEIRDALNRAPKFIKDELSSGEDTAVIIAGISRKYSLHIDVIGTIAELNRNMLLGLIGPDEFLKELIVARVPDKDAREIMTEINQKIFVPLREQMRKGTIAPPQSIKSATPVVPAPAVPPLPKGSYAPPLQSPRYFHLDNKLPAVAGSQQGSPTAGLPKGNDIPNVPSGIPRREGSLPPKVFLPRSAPTPTPRQMNSNRMLEDHEEPHIEFHKTPTPPAPPRPTPPAPAVPKTVPQTPPVQPRIIPPGTRASFAVPKVESTKPSVPTQTVAPVAPKSYQVDPYREPIE